MVVVVLVVVTRLTTTGLFFEALVLLLLLLPSDLPITKALPMEAQGRKETTMTHEF